MAAPVPVSTFKSFCGIAKEVTKSVPVAATDYIPLMEPPNLQPSVRMLADVSNRQSLSANTGMVAGVQATDYSIKGNVFPDTVGYPLAGVFGEVATTGASAPFTHTISLLNSGQGQPTAHTITDNYQANCRYVPGLQWDTFHLSFSADGLLEYTASGLAYPTQTVSAPTPSYSTIAPLAAWVGTLTIGGSSKTILLSADLDVKRALVRDYTVQNSTSPGFIWAGELDVTGTFTFVMEDDTELTRALTNTQPAVVLDFTTGASTALVDLQITMTKCGYAGNPKIDRSGPYPKIQVPFTAIGNTTDVGASGAYGPAKILLKNAKASGTYL